MGKLIVVAGATGNLGTRMVSELLKKGAVVSALIRSESDPEKVNALKTLGAKIVEIDYSDKAQLVSALKDAHCIISTLSGLRETIIDTQKLLIDAAITANVKRFIPSDFSIDFTHLKSGGNRNLDLRRELHRYLENLPISSITIFNGAFMDMLTDQIPLVLFKYKKLLYWGNADQSIDFTTMDNTAEFTANVALDTTTQRFFHIAGDQISPRQMAKVVSNVTGDDYKLFRAGGLTLLKLITAIAKFFNPAKKELYPSWQGMQYMKDMMEGRTKQTHYDNNRYLEIIWTSVAELISAHQKSHSNK
jgi:nucleoside-diphosphate-sugar epimerase